MTDEVFGPLIDGSDVEEALLAHLERWTPTTIAAVRRRRDPEGKTWPNGIAPIRSFTVVHAVAQKWPEDQLPMYLAYSPGMLGAPTVDGEGLMRATWSMTLTAIASGSDIGDTKALARVYSTAAKLAILQHPDLGEFARATDLVAEENFPVSRGVEAERQLMAVATGYTVEVDDVLDTNAGPLDPAKDPETPPADWGKVKEGGGSVLVELQRSGFFGV